MIMGIGSDLLDTRRIEAVIGRQGHRFLDRIFTLHEQERAQGRSNPNGTYAKIFAAKEAVVKALGTGVAKGVSWKDIEIQREQWSAPKVVLRGPAFDAFTKMIPSGKVGSIHLTITDEPPYCLAFVVLSAG